MFETILIIGYNIDMLVTAARGVRIALCYAICQYVKNKIKYMKDYDTHRESSNLKFWDINNLFLWEMSQRVPVGAFILIQNKYKLNKRFTKL